MEQREQQDVDKEPSEELINDYDEFIAQEKKKDIVGQLFTIALSILFNLILGLLFYIYSENEDKYGGSDCSILRICAYYFSLYCFLIVLIRLLALPLLCMGSKQMNAIKIIVNVLNTLEGVFSFIFFVALTVVFFINEPCNALRTLTKVYLIICYTLLLAACCLACCGAGFLASNQG